MTTARPAKACQAPRGEGQWKLGYREPLNPNEQFKKDDNPLNVRARIENIYAMQGFDTIDKHDLRGRMRWWGLYTQREQGYDGTWTGDENTDILEAKYFMMRVRCDGGALSTAALRTLGRDLDRVRPRHRRHLRPGERPVPLDPDRGRARDLEAARRGRPADHRGLRRLPPRGAGLAAGRATRSTRCSTRPPRSTRSCAATSASPSTRTCRASSRPRSRACRTSATRSTTSRSSGSTTPSTAPASTCGSAAACPPTRCWASESAHGCRWTRCPTSGRPSLRCSATTATGGCAPRPG